MRFHWKKIEGIGGIKQILRLWRNDFNEKIEFKDLLQRIDKEFPFDLSWRTKINYLGELVDIKLLGREKKGRQTFYWPLQPAEIVRACILELISQTPEDCIFPSGFLTFFGLNLKVLTVDEKYKLIEIKDEFEKAFRKFMTFKAEVWLRKLEAEWRNTIGNKEIHSVTKCIFWLGYVDSWIRLTEHNENAERALNIPAFIANICEKNGVKIPLEKNRLLTEKVHEIFRKDRKNFEKLTHIFGQIFREEGTGPLALVGATPIRKTPLGEGLYHLKYALEKDLVETVLPQVDMTKRGSYTTKLNEKIATLSEKEKTAERLSKFLFFADALSMEQLERDLCDWVNSEII